MKIRWWQFWKIPNLVYQLELYKERANSKVLDVSNEITKALRSDILKLEIENSVLKKEVAHRQLEASSLRSELAAAVKHVTHLKSQVKHLEKMLNPPRITRTATKRTSKV